MAQRHSTTTSDVIPSGSTAADGRSGEAAVDGSADADGVDDTPPGATTTRADRLAAARNFG